MQPTWAIFYLKQGMFVLNINGKSELINSGDLVILPDDIEFTRSVLEPIVFVYIKFTLDSKCRYSLNIPFGKIDLSENNRIAEDILIYEKLINNEDGASVNYREHLFRDILLSLCTNGGQQLCDNYFNNANSCHDRTVISAIEFVNQNVDKKLSINDICHHIGTNASTLNFKFRRELDTSVGAFIISAKICHAKKLLLGTNYSIGEIAARCGYDNIYYFSSAFKKNTGYTPTEFRNS